MHLCFGKDSNAQKALLTIIGVSPCLLWRRHSPALCSKFMFEKAKVHFGLNRFAVPRSTTIRQLGASVNARLRGPHPARASLRQH